MGSSNGRRPTRLVNSERLSARETINYYLLPITYSCRPCNQFCSSHRKGIFRLMIARAYISSVLIGFLFFLLNVQPLFVAAEPLFEAKSNSCAPAGCHMPKESIPDNKDCEERDCNPYINCCAGIFCFYLAESFISYPANWKLVKQCLPLYDDNRLSSSLSECFHPPELTS